MSNIKVNGPLRYDFKEYVQITRDGEYEWLTPSEARTLANQVDDATAQELRTSARQAAMLGMLS